MKIFRMRIRGPREQIETARRGIELGTDAMAMWNERTQAQLAMQQQYETNIHDWTGPDFEPIQGITIQQYVEIIKAIEATPGGASKTTEIAEQHGVKPGTWDEVMNGWNARCGRNLAVATCLNETYRGVAQ